MFGWPFPHGESVAFVRRIVAAEPDDLGNDVLVEERVECASCALWPTGADGEEDQAAARVTDMMAVAFDPGLDVTAYDAFEARGVRYEIEGRPELWRSPLTGSTPAGMAVGKVVTG